MWGESPDLRKKSLSLFWTGLYNKEFSHHLDWTSRKCIYQSYKSVKTSLNMWICMFWLWAVGVKGSSVAMASPASRNRAESPVCMHSTAQLLVQSESILRPFSAHMGCHYFISTASCVRWGVTALCFKNTLQSLWDGKIGHSRFSASGLRHRCAHLQLGVVPIMLLETGLSAASGGSGGKTKTSFIWITGSFLYCKHTFWFTWRIRIIPP